MMAKATIPLRHAETEVARAGPWADACREVNALLGTGCIVALIGLRGTGKTRMAVSLARQVVAEELERPTRPVSDDDAKCPPDGGWRMERPVVYAKAMAMFMGIRESFKANGPTELQVIAAYTAPRLLIIDEIQERGNSEWEDRMLVHIVDSRYDAKRDTVLIGNLMPDTLASSLGTSIVSRIREVGTVIECAWKGFRP